MQTQEEIERGLIYPKSFDLVELLLAIFPLAKFPIIDIIEHF
jgi:hypothetical protein